ncbi:MAG: hypothetical protein PW792_13395 [Acidobacteriaceae bacterium]|nr:hypothetical protein [Acidobacteriaceae bacterium]
MKNLPARLAIVAALAALSGCSSSTPSSTSSLSADADRYASYTQTYTIPYSVTPNFANLTSTLKVQAQVNGGTISNFTVDTGSVGVVVPASEVPNIPSGSPSGSLTYSSSGLKLTGVWVTMPVVFPQATGSGSLSGKVATATVPVLAVTSGTCTGSGVNSGNCTGTIPHMLGVGYGRGTTTETSPPYNAFLTLAEMTAGTMRRGYTIARDGITLGITSVSSSGYAMAALTSAGTPASGSKNDWTTVSGGFQVGSSAAVTGTVLLDTGLLNMIVENVNMPQSGTLSSGTKMVVTIAQQSYTFALGDGGVQTPTSASYASASHGTYLNTGLRALGHYDYLFDADGGYSGLRPE